MATTPPCRCWPRCKTRTGRLWTYVRDDRPFGGNAPPAAVFFYSPDRSRHASRAASRRLLRDPCRPTPMPASTRSTRPDRKPGPITEAGCWAHARRKLFELADVASKARDQQPTAISPIAFEAVQKFDAIFALEREINGKSPDAAPGRAPQRRRAAGQRSDRVDEARAGQALAPQRSRQGHGLHAQAHRRASRASSTMAASASATMPPSARCAASPSAGSRGCSPAPIAAASAPPSCSR